MTGAVFTAALLLACCLIFLLARLLNVWARRRGSAGLPHLTAWIAVNLLYFPMFFVIYPSFDGHMMWGEFVLFWGIAFTVFRAIHYLHWSCKEKIDPFADTAFSRFLLYMVHFPSFWFGPYQRFEHFDQEVETCKARVNWANRLEGAKRICYGLIKLFVVFHISLPFFYKNELYGPFLDVLFKAPENFDPLQLWLFLVLFLIRVALFVSAVSDGVIGMNLMMGIRVPENSNWPIFARDIQEFWSRWHIQTTVFLREEIFIPVRGIRHRMRGFLLVFAYSGFWHFPSLSAIVAFPLLHLLAMEATWRWKEFWKRHKRQDDWIHRAGLRYKLHDSWLSGAIGIVITININVFTVVFLHDHFFGGTRILPQIFGF
jgi:D-alanyl-lipoteichoic acid acyltransferase DltB (MBOAT superfamily)